MKIRNIVIHTAILFALFTGTAVAEPKNGFGLNAGLASHNMKDQCTSCTSYSSSGLSLGLDYQIAFAQQFSISPFLMGSSESTSVSGVSAGHGILGAQLRYWVGDMFFGGHLGNYSEVLSNGGTSISGSGGGAGLVAGWEKPDGGLYVMGQLDSATVKWSNSIYADTKISAFRLSVGYRWK